MNRRKAFSLYGAAVLAVSLGGSSVWGTILLAPDVTGQVTSVAADAITVGGHLYYVQQGSQAAAALQKLSPGQLVDVYLDGPAASSASHAVTILPHNNQAGN